MSKGRRKPNVLPRQRIITKASDKQAPLSTKEVKLVRTLPDYIMSVYTDGLVVQHKDGMFLLSFMQTQEPLVATLEEVSQLESVETRCMFRATITPLQMARNIDAMEKNFARFLDRSKLKAKDYKEFLTMVKADILPNELAIVDENEVTK